MAKIGVIVAHAREDFVAASIVAAVRNSADLRLVGDAPVMTSDPRRAIPVDRAAVGAIIVIGSPQEVETWSSDLLASSPELVVIRVTVGSDVVHFSRRGVGHDALLETLRALARSPGEDARIADYVAVGTRTMESSPAVALFETTRETTHGLMLAIKWLDSELLSAVSAWQSSQGDLNLGTSAVSQLLSAKTFPQPGDGIVQDNAAALTAHVESSADSADRLARLACRIGLSPLELKAFILCVAPDLDLKYGRAFGFLHDDASRRHATLDLIMTLLGDPVEVRRALFSGHLFESRLLELDATRLPHSDEAVRADPTVVNWLIGGASASVSDRALNSCVRRVAWTGAGLLTRASDQEQRAVLVRFLNALPRIHRWLILVGDTEGWRGLVEVAAQHGELKIVRIDAAEFLALSAPDRLDAVGRLVRNVILDDTVPIVDATMLPSDAPALEALQSLALALSHTRRPCALIAANADRLASVLPVAGLRRLNRPPMDAAMRASYFKHAAKMSKLNLSLTDPQAAAIASVYALPLAQIEQAANLAAASSAWQESPADLELHLRDACRRVAAPNLPKVANRIPAIFSLSQVVLPAVQKAQLAEVVANVRLSSEVLDNWGLGAQLPYGRGVTALFTGPSGCGKTMAAQGIARELGTDLYVIDLSRVVSKWIGETEKNLDTAFSEAEGAGAVLLFDEADALFSRRTPATDAHARHANLEVAYLLQRMEAFTGLAILTTNLRHNLDEAFLRRLRFVIEFPKPDASAREKIWRQCFSGVAQLSDSVNLADLGRRIEVPGGNIRQIALRAAFAAAAEHGQILTKHLHEAARAELLKLGMSSAAGDLTERAA